MAPDTLGARGIFLLLFAAEIERRSRDPDEREKNLSFSARHDRGGQYASWSAPVTIHVDQQLFSVKTSHKIY